MNPLKKSFLFLSGFLLMFFLLSLSVLAATLSSGDHVIISEPVLDDIYLLAGNATIEADVFGDLYVLAGSAVIYGNVDEDLVVAGGRVIVFGDVYGDLRVIGGQVSIYGNVGDDLIILGGMADVGANSVVEGTVLSMAGILNIEGTVREDVRGGLGMFILSGIVEGNVSLTIQDSISLTESAKVYGDLSYSALLETEFPQGTVQGQVRFNEFQEKIEQSNFTLAYLVYRVLNFLSAIVLVFAFVMLLPNALITSSKLTKDNVLKSFGIGVLTVIVIFIGSIILMMTVIGIPIALLFMAFFLFLLYISKIFVAVWLAGYIVDFGKKRLLKTRLFFAMFLAIFAYYLVTFVPYIGWIINIILFLIGVGAIMLVKNDYYGFLKSKKRA